MNILLNGAGILLLVMALAIVGMVVVFFALLLRQFVRECRPKSSPSPIVCRFEVKRPEPVIPKIDPPPPPSKRIIKDGVLRAKTERSGSRRGQTRC